MTTEIHERQKGRWSRWQDYIPLIAIVVLTVCCACAKQIAYGGWNWTNWMHDFMGFFLVVFSMFKFFDMEHWQLQVRLRCGESDSVTGIVGPVGAGGIPGGCYR